MKPRLGVCIAVAAMVMMAALGGQGWAQQPPAAKGATAKPAAKQPAAKDAVAKPAGAGPSASPYRPLAPGVMRPVDPTRKGEETVGRHNVTELIAVSPNFDWAKDVPFRQDVWMLEFKFKPLRLIWVDIPTVSGRMERRLVFYIVYSVTNPGKVLHPVEEADHTYKIVTDDRPVNFIPNFTLEAHNRLEKDDTGFTKAYPDQIIPVAFRDIRKREDPARRFLTTAEMAAYPDIVPPKKPAGKDEVPPKPKGINKGETVWGIVTWTGIDPRWVWCTVSVEGLTNAYRFEDDPAEYQAMLRKENKAPFRTMYHKALKLNFWRPGDEFTYNEEQIRWGVFHHDHSKILDKPDYEWVWRRAF